MYPDTTKKDLVLLVAAILAALTFFWSYGDQHPLSIADNSLGEERASAHAQEILQSLGYQAGVEPNTSFRIQSSLLDSLQVQTSFQDFYSDELNRKKFPVFFWRSEFLIEEVDSDDFSMGPGNFRSIEVTLNEKGELRSLNNSDNIIPEDFFHADVLSYALDIDHPQIPTESLDSTLFDRIQFQFTSAQTTFNSEEEHGTLTQMGTDVAEKMALYHLRNTGWPTTDLQLRQVERVTLELTDAAKVVYSIEDDIINQKIDMSVTVLPTGALLSLNQNVRSGETVGTSWDTIISGIRGAVLLLLVFWILILFIIRFRMRLIDTKAAILVAVLAGFIFPLVLLSQITFDHFNNSGSFDFSFISMVMISAGVTAAFTSLIYFLITAISDSITRQNWVEKLQTIDLLRIGHFFNKPVGLSFIRGIAYSFILAGIWALAYSVMPEGYLTVEQAFYSDDRYLANIVLMLTNMAIFFLVAQLVFLVLLGKLKTTIHSSSILILLVGLIFGIMNPLAVEVGPIYTEFVLLAIVGLILGWIYIRDDFLTVFITLFFFANHLATASGWVMSQSPDAILFFTNILLAFVGLAYGGYSLSTGKTEKELPNFVPEYVDELAQSERIKQELQIARKVQQSFLPVSTPDFEGLDISAVCKPAYETGGDYYDFISLKDDQLGVTIGDVSGKGIQAAFFMTFIKGVIHAVCENFESTVTVLARANKLFKKNAGKGIFISLIFGVVDVKRDLFTFSRAGHNPLLFFKSNEKKLYTYTPEGIGLGITEDETFRKNISELSLDFQQNDIIILYTDGVVEATNNLNRYYGDNRLQKLIETYHESSADTLLNKIVEDLYTFGDGTNQHDDMTLVVIKKK
ncbi:PP2C family protein-serine/threonine phosphatase [Rhodohalobacter sp.]|uniref:PP2C family protein-serine/threonine phosphatase n=1 Tax=Rhodohalobacter sp. TaxID=1974210 RepID=UPI002ACE4121|nr:SpoIIE family protein phosphatase [Rhodohalobacter sp.]MDZ7755300.1 SpoIIE family protein phosphatase [Rhodohalobacter sp.]